MTEIAAVFGTRPELVKVASVIDALRAEGIAVTVLNTGQHTSMLDDALMQRLRPTALGIASDGSIPRFMARAGVALRAAFAELKPRVVLVQGDTMSASVAALTAHEMGIPVAHVEAGVRSGNDAEPWPEELFRIGIDRVAALLYAPTELAAQQLKCEDETTPVFVTGNTSIDVLRASGVEARGEASPQLLVTLHRRELRNRSDALEVLQALCDAIGESGGPALWPVHPGMHEFMSQLRIPGNFAIRPPMQHTEMLRILSEARGVLTDSGGLVEEAAHLGVPTAILRGANDRREAVLAGIAQEFAPSIAGVKAAVATLAARRIPRRVAAVYGAGDAGKCIATHLAAILRAT